MNLSKTSTNQKSLSSQLTAKANEDLAQEPERVYFEDFAAAENEALLETMYLECNNREDEMKYSEIEIALAV